MIKLIKYLFTTLVTVAFASCSSDEDPSFGGISGRVYDYATHEPLAGAQVSLSPSTRTITTDNQGNFVFQSLESGTYVVSASLKGYETASSHISVNLGETAHTDILLKQVAVMGNLQLSTTSLTFDKGVNELTLEIKNVGENGSIKWGINLITVDWLTVTPKEGTLGEGMSTVVKVIVDRSSIPEGKSMSTSFNVSSGDSSRSVSVLVNNATGGNESTIYGLVKGKVVSSVDNSPIANASITDAYKGIAAKSDASGNFIIEKLTPGNYSFTAVAEGFEPSSKTMFVGEGTTTNLSFSLTPQNTTISVTASTEDIDFGLTSTKKTLTLTNNSNITAEWTVFETTSYPLPAWLSLSAKKGSIAPHGKQDITLTVNRSYLTGSYGAYILGINGEFEGINVTVRVEKNDQGGGQPPQNEDYSTAKIVSCDSRVIAKIVSCRRSGDTVTFQYTLTNSGLGTVIDWRIYPPKSMSLIQGGTRSVVWTSDGKSYDYPTMSFNGSTTTGSNVINTTFPEGPACSGSVTISGVSSSAKEFNLTLGVFAYPDSYYNMASSAVKFTGVPIY